jgi:toxin ParE1/3/4
MRVHWTVPALAAMEDLQDYIAQDSPVAAGRVAARITEAINGLVSFPLRGRPGRVSGTFELVIPRTSYTAAYRLRGNFIEVIAVLHQAQQWPESFD